MGRIDPGVLRLMGFVGSLALLATLLVVANRIFLPLLLGLAVAYLLDPAVCWFERRGRSRVLGTIFIATVAVLVTAAILLILVPILAEQVRELGERLPEYRAAIEARARPVLDQLEARYPEQIDQLRIRAAEVVRERWPQMVESAVSWLGDAFSSFLSFLLFLLDLIFVPVFAFYLLVDFPKLKAGLTDLIPVPYREVILDRTREIDGAVASFLRGQLTIAIILAAINAIGLTILGVPLGLLVGIVAGLANMIPYMALIVGLAPAMLLVWIEHQSLARLIGVILVFAGAQMLEGTVLSPRILSKEVNLHPVWVLLSIIIGGRTFGIVGMLVAVPVAAAIQVVVRHWLIAYRSSGAYLGSPAPPDSG